MAAYSSPPSRKPTVILKSHAQAACWLIFQDFPFAQPLVQITAQSFNISASMASNNSRLQPFIFKRAQNSSQVTCSSSMLIKSFKTPLPTFQKLPRVPIPQDISALCPKGLSESRPLIRWSLKAQIQQGPDPPSRPQSFLASRNNPPYQALSGNHSIPLTQRRSDDSRSRDWLAPLLGGSGKI